MTEYNELLYKSGKVINNLKLFINTLQETGIVSKNKIDSTKKFMTQQLLTDDAVSILNEYTAKVAEVKLLIKEKPLTDEEITEFIIKLDYEINH